jgi:predicted RNase H-like nuclease (RuvC/YqgF family)
MPSGTEALKLPAIELFNRANEFMSRGIDAVVEDMTRDQRTQIENLTLEAKTLRSCLSEAIAERDSLKRQLEELREDTKGMEEYIQKISDMASRFTRRD